MEAVQPKQDVKAGLTEKASKKEPPLWIVFYVVFITIGVCLILFQLFVSTPVITSASATDFDILDIFLKTAGIMLCCGALGSSLYDLRGLTQHSADFDYDRRYNISYLVRPFSGALSGLFVFFLLLGGALAFDINSDPAQNHGMGWATFTGRMPFITFALLAGYASHAFMLKLKDISDSVFASRSSMKMRGSDR